MLKVGITGGIGSGKSTVCAVFQALGIPVLYADEVARLLMQKDHDLIAEIKSLLGVHLYKNGQLDRKALAEIVFNDKEKLNQLNALVHPATIKYSTVWLNSQNSAYVIKEAAIFFESGSNKGMDIMIGVSAPHELRISRVMHRSASSRAEVLTRMAQQMDEEQKMNLCDFVIINDDSTPILPQILELHQLLLQRSETKQDIKPEIN